MLKTAGQLLLLLVILVYVETCAYDLILTHLHASEVTDAP